MEMLLYQKHVTQPAFMEKKAASGNLSKCKSSVTILLLLFSGLGSLSASIQKFSWHSMQLCTSLWNFCCGWVWLFGVCLCLMFNNLKFILNLRELYNHNKVSVKDELKICYIPV